MRDEPADDVDRPFHVVGPVIEAAQDALAGLGEVVPRLVERSRRQFDFALAVFERLRCGSTRAGDRVTDDHVTDDRADDVGRDERRGARPRPHSASGAPGGAPTLAVVPDPTPEPTSSVETIAAPPASTLAIPDYDSLAASQVLPRLEGLSDDELEAIRAYEAAHRSRRTVLGRLAQLLA